MIKEYKIKSRRKVQQLSAAFFMGVLVLASCKKEVTNIGDGLQEGSLGTALTDTFTLITYSEEVPDVETDETAVNLLGSYVDPVFGKVDCGIVTQIRLSAINPLFGPTATLVMDSVILSLAYTSIKHYANSQPISVEVYELNEDIDRETGTYYTYTTPQTTGPNLVEAGFTNTGYYKPDVVAEVKTADDTLAAHLRVRLDPTLFGMEMVNANDAGQLSSDETFVSFFKGLQIKVNGTGLAPGEGSVYYLALENSLSNVTMYFHDSGDNVKKKFTFTINSSCARYNDIKFDRTGTDVEAVLLDSTLGKENFYMQGSGIRAIIHVPYLMDFNYDSIGNWDPKIINKAELILPIQDFTIDPFDPSVSLFMAKIVSDTLSEFTLDYPSTSSGLSAVSYNEANKEFRFLVTRELQAMLNGSRDFRGFRIYCPAFFGSSIERVVFNGSASTLKKRPRLEITYTNY
jgi:hypothetical protein